MEQTVGLVLKELIVRKPKASKWPLIYLYKFPWSVKALGSTGVRINKDFLGGPVLYALS